MFKKDIILTEEQEKGVDDCVEFINNGNPKEIFLLDAKAGCGKTTIIRKVLSKFKNRSIVVSALSHKAKKVITESVKQDNIPCKSVTLAALLGMILDQETGKFTRDFNFNPLSKKKPLIYTADIIILDEASMLNEQSLELIFQLKKINSKVICLSDRGQLEPIREKDHENAGKISPVFNTKHKITLTKSMRQVENHPILNYSNYYWNNSQLEFPSHDPIPPELRVDTIVGESKLIFKDSIEELFDILEEKFRDAILTNDPNKLKIVTYRNNTRRSINDYFHKKLFFDSEKNEIKEWNKNEWIIFNDNYQASDNVLIDNSSEFQIKKVLSSIHKVDNKEFKIYALEIDVYDIDDEMVTILIKVLAKESVDDYNVYVSELFKKAKTFPEKTEKRRNALSDAWEAKNMFAKIDYGYAITIYRAQGSTYNSIVVHETDILTTPISNATKSRAIYTALTRARYEVYVV